MTEEKAQELVKKGSEWLDSVKPNWKSLVNLEILDLDSNTKCICGQVFNDDKIPEETGFDYAANIVGTKYQLSLLGFGEIYGSNDLLQQTWIKVLNES